MTRITAIAFLSLLTLMTATRLASAEDTQALMRDRIEQLLFSGELSVQGVEIAATKFLPDFYARRHFTLAWSSPKQLDQLRALARLAQEEGLDVADYPLTELEGLVSRVVNRDRVDLRVDADILATEILIRIAYQLRFGKVNPEQLDANWNFDRQFLTGADPVQTLQAIIDAPDMRYYVKQRLRRGPFYESLMRALAQYRGIAAQGGWPKIPEGPTLRPGDSDPRVATLRSRLAVSGDYPADAPLDSDSFDEALEVAVKHYQSRHNLEPDGIIGKNTLVTLNVPVESRIDQLRTTLERARWVFNEVTNSNDFVLVNIAGFRLGLVREGKFVWTTRVVVGRPYHKTPVFKDAMEYIVFNPTWTVPASITKKELLTKIKRDPNYLTSHNYTILDRSGREVNPANIDWASASPVNFNYTLRQGPGPGNALGRVKFIFPNEHAVYLHDTPSRSLFNKAERSFSHGCVRVHKPLILAEKVLNDMEHWGSNQINDVLESGETKTVYLKEPLPVYILYWTASVDLNGTVRFFKDVYDRDPRVLKALNGPVSIKLPGEA